MNDTYVDQMRAEQENGENQHGVLPDKVKAQVWKLSESPLMDPSPLPQLNTFTLQETLFVEQLTAIDERVRYQVYQSYCLQCFISSIRNSNYLTPIIIKSFSVVLHIYTE